MGCCLQSSSPLLLSFKGEEFQALLVVTMAIKRILLRYLGDGLAEEFIQFYCQFGALPLSSPNAAAYDKVKRSKKHKFLHNDSTV